MPNSQPPCVGNHLYPHAQYLHAATEPNPNQAKPAAFLPLQEVAGRDGLIRVHVPFSLSKLSHIEKLLGSYTSNTTILIKQSQYLTQSYNLSFHDIYMILSNNLLPEEHRRVWEHARQHADNIHQTLASNPPRKELVPEQEQQWDCNTPSGVLARDWFLDLPHSKCS